MADLENKKTLSNNLKYYMSINNKSRNDICNDLHLKYSTVRDWELGNIYPRIDKIEMLANYFNIQKSDLIEEKQNLLTSQLRNELLLQDYINNLSRNAFQKDLLTNCLMLNDNYTKIANEQVEFYISKQEHEEIKNEYTKEEYNEMINEINQNEDK